MAKYSISKVFPNTDSPNMSLEFEVTEKMALIQIKGLQATDFALVEFRFGEECDESWEPFNWCCGQMRIDQPANNFIIPIPGKYRLVLADTGNLFASDPTRFADVEIQVSKFASNQNLAEYIKPCC